MKSAKQSVAMKLREAIRRRKSARKVAKNRKFTSADEIREAKKTFVGAAAG